MNFNSSNEWDDIQEQVKRIIANTGVEVDSDYIKELEEMFNINFDDLNVNVGDYLNKKTIYVQKTNEDAVSPSYAYTSDSGFDLFSIEKIIIPPFGRALVPTGLKLSIPEGFEIQVRPKSGLALNMGLTVLNTPGTVDQGYTGEIQVILFNTNNNSIIIEKGMKIAQAVLSPVVHGKYVNFVEVDNIEDKDRGINGFGSTGI